MLSPSYIMPIGYCPTGPMREYNIAIPTFKFWPDLHLGPAAKGHKDPSLCKRSSALVTPRVMIDHVYEMLTLPNIWTSMDLIGLFSKTRETWIIESFLDLAHCTAIGITGTAFAVPPVFILDLKGFSEGAT